MEVSDTTGLMIISREKVAKRDLSSVKHALKVPLGLGTEIIGTGPQLGDARIEKQLIGGRHPVDSIFQLAPHDHVGGSGRQSHQEIIARDPTPLDQTVIFRKNNCV